MKIYLVSALVGLLLFPAACGQTTSNGSTLNVLAGSELKDLEPILADFEKSSGTHLAMHYVGSLEGAERIVNGDSSDLAWFSSGRYLSLLAGSTSKIVAKQQTMLSPVVIGVKHSTAVRLGWSGNPDVTWRDIADRSKSHELRFAMTNPAASNSGFVALVGVAQAFAGTPDALQSGTINTSALKDFFTGQTLTAGSSGFLASSYVQRQSSLDGVINYESVLLSMNASGKLQEPLDLIYPKDGIMTADYPLMLLQPQRRAIYDRLISYLRQPDTQRRIMTMTGRRPAIPAIQLDSRFPKQTLLELPFPSSLNIVNKLMETYLNDVRHPSHTVFVLDTSGSMAGSRLDSLKRALINLTGADTSLTGRFARFRNHESVTLITFSDQVQQQRTFQIDDVSSGSKDLMAIRGFVGSLDAGGGTAIYDALETAYRLAGSSQAADPDDYHSIVLMTDGENNAGVDGSTFLSDYRGWPDSQRRVPTFPVLFGEASPPELQQIASTTNGQLFDARNADLSQVFKEIRGYQ